MDGQPFLWILLGVLASAVIAYLLLRRRPASPPPDPILVHTLQGLQQGLGELRESIRSLPSGDSLNALKDRVAGVESRVPHDLSGSVQHLQESFVRVETALHERKQLEELSQAALRKIEAVLVGGQSRGAAGEVVLEQAFAQFPPEMADTQFKVNGKPVEFALVLPSRKRLPIDSKWPAVRELELYAAATDPVERQELLARIEKNVAKKVEDVTKYIDAATTTTLAVAAIPDAAYFACRTAHITAYRQRVLLMPYSMTVPFLLALYNLHLQFARSVDAENLEAYLSQIEDYLNQFEDKLENSVNRGATMVLNAYPELRQRIGEMRGKLASLRQSPTQSLSEQQQSLLRE